MSGERERERSPLGGSGMLQSLLRALPGILSTQAHVPSVRVKPPGAGFKLVGYVGVQNLNHLTACRPLWLQK